MTDFVECDGCSKKLGSPILCSSCAANRRSIADLQKKLAEVEAERDEWQPIETAPKDGTKVILWLPDFHSVEMAWFCVPAEASHWMPLPTPPKGTIDMADHDHMKDA